MTDLEIGYCAVVLLFALACLIMLAMWMRHQANKLPKPRHIVRLHYMYGKPVKEWLS